jgi:hypothetical protein
LYLYNYLFKGKKIKKKKIFFLIKKEIIEKLIINLIKILLILKRKGIFSFLIKKRRIYFKNKMFCSYSK